MNELIEKLKLDLAADIEKFYDFQNLIKKGKA